MIEELLSLAASVTATLTSAAASALEAPLGALGIDALGVPERLPLVVVAVAAAIWLGLRDRPRAIGWPGMAEARRAGGKSIEWMPGVALVLRALGIGCLALVLAEPVVVDESPPEPGDGLDMILVLDISASMRALDTGSGGLRPSAGETDEADEADGATAVAGPYTQTRLDLAKRVVTRFAKRRAGEGDRVGLVVFGSKAFTQCPLTSDGELLAAALARVEVGMAGDATALGDALALAVKRAPASVGGTGRVIVLLTDGRSNAGNVPLEVATALAVGESLRVHTVGIGTHGATVPVAKRNKQGERQVRFERHDTDPTALQHIANATGGRYFEATRPADLTAVYREIDSLERVERPMPPRIHQALRAEPLLAGAGGLLLLEIVLARLLRRRLL